MENASQALFMAAGVLIAVMVISIGVYLFSSASTIAESYDTTMSATEIQKFNSKFEKYAKKANYIKEKIDDDGKRTYEYSNTAEDEGFVFHDYNTISDVVSAMNLAYSINAKNNYDIQSGIQVSVSGSAADGWDYGIIGITPRIQRLISLKKDDVDYKSMCYPISNSDIKLADEDVANPACFIPMTDLLSKYNNSKLENSERIYEYGFKGETILNTETGLIDIIKFTLVKNENF